MVLLGFLTFFFDDLALNRKAFSDRLFKNDYVRGINDLKGEIGALEDQLESLR